MEVGVSCSAPDLLAMHLCDVDSYPLVPPESLSKVCSHIKTSCEESGQKLQRQGFRKPGKRWVLLDTRSKEAREPNRASSVVTVTTGVTELGWSTELPILILFLIKNVYSFI